jgi:hypothetical protein
MGRSESPSLRDGRYRVEEPFRVQVLRPEANHGVSALLKVASPRVNVDHGGMD